MHVENSSSPSSPSSSSSSSFSFSFLVASKYDWLRKWMAHVCPHDLRLGVPQCCFRHRQKETSRQKVQERKREQKMREHTHLLNRGQSRRRARVVALQTLNLAFARAFRHFKHETEFVIRLCLDVTHQIKVFTILEREITRFVQVHSLHLFQNRTSRRVHLLVHRVIPTIAAVEPLLFGNNVFRRVHGRR